MSLESAVSRAAFARDLAGEASSGRKGLLLALLGAGKTHTLVATREALGEKGVPFMFLDLFTAASTVSKMGKPFGSFCPPLPGVTPPTIFVP